MTKIKMKTPLVEMQGDEMTRVIWDWIKEILICPRVDLKAEFYDLGLPEREKTADRVTAEAASAIKRLGVGVKCATITPNAQRADEYKLTKMWASPNGTIRSALDGTVFRSPVIVKGIRGYIPTWTKPIVIARHAYGDLYKNAEIAVDAPAKAELTVTYADGRTARVAAHNFDGGGVLQAQHNTDKSVLSFARACFNYALEVKTDLWFAAKDTISKIYDRRFKDIFADVFETEYKGKFAASGIKYEYTLIDDSVARLIRGNGGVVWALKNYDGDVMSDMVAAAFGSLAMMTSVLASPDGKFEFEAAHGTVTRHYYRHIKGEKTSTNPVATLFAWTGALKKRGQLDGLPDLEAFASRLENAALGAIRDGFMTLDLVPLFAGEAKGLNTVEFLEKIAERI